MLTLWEGQRSWRLQEGGVGLGSLGTVHCTVSNGKEKTSH